MATIDDCIRMGYSIETTKQPDGTWLVAVNELPGCEAVGNTPMEAIDNLVPIIGSCIEAANEAKGRRLREAARATADEAIRA